MGNFWGPIAAGLAIVSLTGCSASLPDLSVKRNWAEAVRRFALIPVYPMREDVLVGDVRLIGGRISDETLGYRNFKHLPIEAVARAYDNSRPTLPTTAPVQLKSGDNETLQPAWVQPTADDIYRVSDGYAPVKRMRLASLPGISLVSVASSDAGIRGAIESVAVALGMATSSEKRLDITLRSIETMEIDDADAYAALKYGCGSWDVEALRFSAANLTAGAKDGEKVEPVTLNLVVRVFYARAIEYSFGDTTSAAGRLALGVGVLPPTPATTPGGGGAADEGQAGQPTPTPQEVETALGDFAAATQATAPGVVASVYRRQDGQIVLKEVFERPLAFAADVLTFDLATLLASAGKTEGQGRLKCDAVGLAAAPQPDGPAVLGGPAAR